MQRYVVHAPFAAFQRAQTGRRPERLPEPLIEANRESELKEILRSTPGAWAEDRLSGEAIRLMGDDLFTYSTEKSRVAD
jgi:hypothetical protein